ncbi:transposable element Tcb1 transposase [Trichonephila clavipes]|nr:transposable element Tcb1 transposase [Trichonephila clavipes]
MIKRRGRCRIGSSHYKLSYHNYRDVVKHGPTEPGTRVSPFKLHVKWKIGCSVGRNQTTVMRICDRWMQEGTTDRRGRSHPPQCTTSREGRQLVRMAVMDRLVTSRTVAHHIDSVTHHSVSARTIRRRSQQSGLSARRSLLGLPLT